MAGITHMTRAAWAEAERHVCADCGKPLTIGKVHGFTPAVGDKPALLHCGCTFEKGSR